MDRMCGIANAPLNFCLLIVNCGDCFANLSDFIVNEVVMLFSLLQQVISSKPNCSTRIKSFFALRVL
uniref:Macrophage migration inhibitory factor n=1 Tax=Parascaris univalens TaxID=6257 RepID=A0A915BR16_PARUN